MVRKHEKYKWHQRANHFAVLNNAKARRRLFEQAIMLGSMQASIFEKLPLSLQSELWPPDVVTCFERESGTTNPAVFMTVKEES